MLPYLYIAGASFSGSTLLAFLLNAHPRMMSVSEPCGLLSAEQKSGLSTYRCSCGELLLECPFYRQMQSRIEAAGSSFDLADWRTHFQLSRHRSIDIPLSRSLGSGLFDRVRDAAVRFLPGYRGAVREIALRNYRFASAALSISGKSVYVDAQKDPARIRFLSEIEEVDLRVVHLIRDARGGSASYMKHNPRNDVTRAARKWRKVNLETDRARRYVSPDRWLLIRYSELCEDVQATLDRISDHVGVERAPISDSFYETEHHIVGNQMRLQAIEGIRLDESWKKRLSDRDLVRIAQISGRTNRYFGYDWPPGQEGSV